MHRKNNCCLYFSKVCLCVAVYICIVVGLYFTPENYMTFLFPDDNNYYYHNIGNSMAASFIFYVSALLIIGMVALIVKVMMVCCCKVDQQLVVQPSEQNKLISSNDNQHIIIPITSCKKCNATGRYYIQEWILCNGCNGSGLLSDGYQRCNQCSGYKGKYEHVLKYCNH